MYTITLYSTVGTILYIVPVLHLNNVQWVQYRWEKYCVQACSCKEGPWGRVVLAHLNCTELNCTALLYCTALHCTALHYYTALHCTALLYCIALQCTTVYDTMMNCIIRHYTILHLTVWGCYTVKYKFILYNTVLHCATLIRTVCQYYTTLYNTKLHGTILNCTV